MPDSSGKKKSIFREKNMQKLASPEELNDYIRIASPGAWVAVVAILVLLAGFILWASLGAVTVHDDDGTSHEISPITYILN